MAFTTTSALSSFALKNISYNSTLMIRDVSFTLILPTSIPSNTYTSHIDSVNNIMYVVGYTPSSMIMSTNNGTNWTTMTIPPTNNLQSIASDGSLVIIGSNGGQYNISKSFDGGNTWTKSYLGTGPYNTAPGFSFSIPPDCILMAQNRLFISSNGNGCALSTSYNGNLRLVSTTSSPPINNVPQYCFNSCGNTDLSRIYIGSKDGYIHIVNVEWGIDNSSTIITCDVGNKLNKPSTTLLPVKGLACSSDGTIVYACLQEGQIYKSTDSGLNFTILTNSPSVPSGNANIWRSLDCSSDGSVVIVCRYNEKIYVSGDGGESWKSNNTVKLWINVYLDDDGSKFICCTTTTYYVGFINYL